MICLKKVLHLRSSGGLLGAERVIIEICKNSAANGFESHVGVIHNTQDQIPEFFKILNDQNIPNTLISDSKLFSWSRIKQIKDYCYKNNISIIHSHGYKEDVHAVFCRGIPKIATNHLWKRTNLKSRFYAYIDMMALRYFNQVLGVSEEIVSELKSKGLSKALKISNGIDLKLFDTTLFNNSKLKEALSIVGDDIIMGMISSLTPEKNHITALNAFFKISIMYPNVKLFIVGDGPQRSLIEVFIKEKMLENKVQLLGIRSDIPELLSIMDIFLLPSKTEGLPMALLEAMASGKAIIASLVGEIPNVIKSGQDGVLIDINFQEHLVNAMDSLVNNISLRRNLGSSALERAKDFSSVTMTKKYCAIYTKVLDKIKT